MESGVIPALFRALYFVGCVAAMPRYGKVLKDLRKCILPQGSTTTCSHQALRN